MTKISDLSDGGTLQSTDELIVVRSGGNAKAKMNTLPDMTVSQSPSVPSSSAQIFYNSTKGAVLRGQGSTSDVTLENDAGQTALKVPTGTQRVDLTSLTVTNDVAVGSVTANATLDVTGSTGIYQRHSSGGSIVLDDTDTADASSPMVYVRNTSGQLRFGGANRNGTTKQTTGSVDYVTIDSANTVFNSGSADSDFTVRSDNNTHALVVNGGNSAVSIGGTGSDKRLNVFHSANATTGVHVENLTSGASARASLALRSDGGFLYFFATSQSYTGVASWQDAAVIANSSSLAGGIVVNSQAGGITLQDSTVSRLEIVPNSELVINQSGIDRDFRVESNSDTHALFLDGLTGNVGIGTSSPGHLLTVDGAAKFGSIGPIEVGTNVFKASNTGSNGFLLRSAISSAGNPSFSSVDDTNTGMFLPSGDVIGFSTAGSERMRIDSVGDVGIGTTSPGVPLHVVGRTDTNVCIIDATGTPPNYILSVRDDNSSIFQVKRTEIVVNESAATGVDFRVESGTSTHALFIDSGSGSGAGVIHSNGTSQTPYTQTTGAGQLAYRLDNGSAYGTLIQSNNAANGWAMMYCNKYAYQSGYDRRYIVWYVNGGALATLQLNAAGTQVEYNTSSDRRLKDNIVDINDGITRLKQLKPRKYEWVGTDFNAEGFIADEADGIVPEAVKGEVNAVDDKGNPVYQQIEYAKYVPLITAALQESISKIENLETRLSKLEN